MAAVGNYKSIIFFARLNIVAPPLITVCLEAISKSALQWTFYLLHCASHPKKWFDGNDGRLFPHWVRANMWQLALGSKANTLLAYIIQLSDSITAALQCVLLQDNKWNDSSDRRKRVGDCIVFRPWLCQFSPESRKRHQSLLVHLNLLQILVLKELPDFPLFP